MLSALGLWGCVRQLIEVVDAGHDADLSELDDHDSESLLLAITEAEERMASLRSQVLADWEARKEWAEHSRSASVRLTAMTGRPAGRCRRDLRTAARLRQSELVKKRWRAGDLGTAQAEALAELRRPGLEEAFDRDEVVLADLAAELPYAEFRKALAYWEQVNTEDTEPEGIPELGGSFTLLPTTGGYVFHGTCDGVSGAELAEAIRRIEEQFFADDWAEAKERLGDDVHEAALRRTPAERRYDALMELVRLGAGAPPGTRKPRPLVHVGIDGPTFFGRMCEILETGRVITPFAVAGLLHRADVRRVVHGLDGRVIEVSKESRFFTGALREAVMLRDGGECCEPGCHRRVNLEADHHQRHADGGPTDLGNGRPRCRACHRWKSAREQRPPPQRE